MPRIIQLPIFWDRPTNPARTNLLTGDIEINMHRFSRMPEYMQDFVMLHEQGHYELQTFSEVEADRYALSHLALKKPESLWHYVESVSNVSYDNPERVSDAALQTLRIAADKGSGQAKQILRGKLNVNADGVSSININTLAVLAFVLMAVLILFFYE